MSLPRNLKLASALIAYQRGAHGTHPPRAQTIIKDLAPGEPLDGAGGFLLVATGWSMRLNAEVFRQWDLGSGNKLTIALGPTGHHV